MAGSVWDEVLVAQGRDQATVRRFFSDLGDKRARLLTHVSAVIRGHRRAACHGR